jgi:hypothetical protein
MRVMNPRVVLMDECVQMFGGAKDLVSECYAGIRRLDATAKGA